MSGGVLIAGALPLLQSSLQKVELEDEVNLVYAVVTLPAGDDTSAYLFFLDDKTGNVLKKTEMTTWKQVKCNIEVKELSLRYAVTFAIVLLDYREWLI